MSLSDNKTVNDVTQDYERAEAASLLYNTGMQPDIAALMRSAYMHGYVDGHRDGRSHSNGGAEP